MLDKNQYHHPLPPNFTQENRLINLFDEKAARKSINDLPTEKELLEDIDTPTKAQAELKALKSQLEALDKAVPKVKNLELALKQATETEKTLFDRVKKRFEICDYRISMIRSAIIDNKDPAILELFQETKFILESLQRDLLAFEFDNQPDLDFDAQDLEAQTHRLRSDQLRAFQYIQKKMTLKPKQLIELIHIIKSWAFYDVGDLELFSRIFSPSPEQLFDFLSKKKGFSYDAFQCKGDYQINSFQKKWTNNLKTVEETLDFFQILSNLRQEVAYTAFNLFIDLEPTLDQFREIVTKTKKLKPGQPLLLSMYSSYESPDYQQALAFIDSLKNVKNTLNPKALNGFQYYAMETYWRNINPTPEQAMEVLEIIIDLGRHNANLFGALCIYTIQNHTQALEILGLVKQINNDHAILCLEILKENLDVDMLTLLAKDKDEDKYKPTNYPVAKTILQEFAQMGDNISVQGLKRIYKADAKDEIFEAKSIEFKDNAEFEQALPSSSYALNPQEKALKKEILAKKDPAEIMKLFQENIAKIDLSPAVAYSGTPETIKQAININAVWKSIEQENPQLAAAYVQHLEQQSEFLDQIEWYSFNLEHVMEGPEKYKDQIFAFFHAIPNLEVFSKIKKQKKGIINVILGHYWQEIRPMLGHLIFNEGREDYYQRVQADLEEQNIPFDQEIECVPGQEIKTHLTVFDLNKMKRTRYPLVIKMKADNTMVWYVKDKKGQVIIKIVNPRKSSNYRMLIKDALLDDRLNRETYLLCYFPKVTFSPGKMRMNMEYEDRENFIGKAIKTTGDIYKALDQFKETYKDEEAIRKESRGEIEKHAKILTLSKTKEAPKIELKELLKIIYTMDAKNIDPITIAARFDFDIEKIHEYQRKIEQILETERHMTRIDFGMKVIEACEGNAEIGLLLAYYQLYKLGLSEHNILFDKYPDAFQKIEGQKNPESIIYHFCGCIFGGFALQRLLVDRYYTDPDFQQKTNARFQSLQNRLEFEYSIINPQKPTGLNEHEMLELVQLYYLINSSVR